MRSLPRPRALIALVLSCTALGTLSACGSGAQGPSGSAGSSRPSTSTSAGPTSSTAPSSTPAPTPPTTTAPTTRPPATTPSTPRPSTPTPSGLPASLLGRDWERIPTSRAVVALTFDAGASAAGVASILGTLGREHVPATFFLTARFAEQYPAQARQIAAGYRVGNHSITHPRFTALSDAQIRSELLGAAATIRRISGDEPAPFFRFPFGDRDARTIAAVNALGYVPVRWTVDTLGWKGTSGGISADTVLQRVLSALQPGEIVLMHVGSNPDDGTTLDAEALPRVISALRARGYGFVTLDALLGAT